MLPTLALIVQNVLVIPGSSTASEREISSAVFVMLHLMPPGHLNISTVSSNKVGD